MIAMSSDHDVLPEVVSYYETRYDEEPRLSGLQGQLEQLRTRVILSRYLPGPPAQVLDVGGGSGPYAFWLAQQGYEVTLIDAVPRHVDRALAISQEGTRGVLKACAIGDARALQQADESADAVLLLGPLYHLPALDDRLLALREACRVLRPGGVCVAAAISRFASMLDGYFDGGIEDPEFLAIVKQDLADGRHENPTDKPYFTTAYFHHPDALADEMAQARLDHVVTLPVEGPFWMLKNLADYLADDGARVRLLEMLALIEQESTLIGCSAHVLAVARKPGG
jgi:ubiquinone/menaquinone biosynthesis C-methylase UbiE